MSTQPTNTAMQTGHALATELRELFDRPKHQGGHFTFDAAAWLTTNRNALLAALSVAPSPAAADAEDMQRVVDSLESIASFTGLASYIHGIARSGLAAARRLLDAPPGVGERREPPVVRAADAMAASIIGLVDLHRIDARSAAADAALSYCGIRCGVYSDEINAFRKRFNIEPLTPIAAPAPAEGARAKATRCETRDGVPITIGMRVIAYNEWREVISIYIEEGGATIRTRLPDTKVGAISSKPHDLFSTRAAAEASLAASAPAGGVATGEGGK